MSYYDIEQSKNAGHGKRKFNRRSKSQRKEITKHKRERTREHMAAQKYIEEQKNAVMNKIENGIKSVTDEETKAAKYTNAAVDLYSLGRLTIYTEETVKQRISLYFTYCTQNDITPTISGLAIAFGITPAALSNKIHSTKDSMPESVKEQFQNAKALIEYVAEQRMIEGKVNPAAAIFQLKNRHGWKDVTETVVTKTEEPMMDISALKKEAEMLPIVEVQEIEAPAEAVEGT